MLLVQTLGCITAGREGFATTEGRVRRDHIKLEEEVCG